MEKLYEFIERKRRLFMIITYTYIVFLGCSMFPINMSHDIPLLLLILVGYFYIAYIFCGLYKKKPLLVFFFTWVFNSIGLLCRVLLEWGEYSMTRDLTLMNVGIHLILIPAFVTLVYIIIPLKN